MIPIQNLPPNQPLTKEELKRKWLRYAIGGLFLFSIGLMLVVQVVQLRLTGKDPATWWLFGLISLVCVNAGLMIFGQGVIFKSQLDYRLRRKEEQKSKDADKKTQQKKRYYNNKNKKKKDGDGSATTSAAAV